MPKKIMVVDDRDDVLLLITKILEKDYDVITVSSVEDMFLHLNNITPSLIILDIEIPGKLNGFDAMKQLKNIPKWERIPVFMLTGYGPNETLVNQCLEKNVEVIEKRYLSTVLLNVVNRHIKRSSL
jgi:DNA-binding NtrC family response regulator